MTAGRGRDPAPNRGRVPAISDGHRRACPPAMRQGKNLAESPLRPGSDFNEEAVPSVSTHPQIARSGWPREESSKRNRPWKSRRADFAANITARTGLMGPGFVKLLFDRERLADRSPASRRANSSRR